MNLNIENSKKLEKMKRLWLWKKIKRLHRSLNTYKVYCGKTMKRYFFLANHSSFPTKNDSILRRFYWNWIKIELESKLNQMSSNLKWIQNEFDESWKWTNVDFALWAIIKKTHRDRIQFTTQSPAEPIHFVYIIAKKKCPLYIRRIHGTQENLQLVLKWCNLILVLWLKKMALRLIIECG